MKKSDIRNGTLIIMAFTMVCFTAILFFADRNESVVISKPVDQTISSWIDTLTNKSSHYPPLNSMDSRIERFRSKWELKGLSLAVVRHDSLLYAKGYGWADQEGDVKMQPTSIMRIASASKLVTAAAIMKLVEEGKLSLDDKVFGPDGILSDQAYTDTVNDKRIFDITVDHLLQHKGGFTLRSGDPMFNTVDIMEAKRLTSPPSNEELTAIVLGRRLGFEPGNGRRYSNFGYMLLSLVIEKVTGRSYWDYVSEEILKPAGAFDFKPGTNYYEERHDKEVKYYGPDNEKVKEFNGSGRMVDRVYGGSNINGLAGAGGWITSAPGLARFVASIDGDSTIPDVISPESVRLMTFNDDEDKQTRGWVDSDGKGKWTRTGTLSSTHSLILRYPDGECWVLITNSGVWTGHKFSKDLLRLVEDLRRDYSDKMPSRNLW